MPRAGGDRRGSNRNRRQRKLWLIATFDPDLGPDRVRCHLGISEACAGELTVITVTADRINPGGTYCHDNIQPACRACQTKQGALITNEKRAQWFEWMREADEAGIEWDGVM